MMNSTSSQQSGEMDARLLDGESLPLHDVEDVRASARRAALEARHHGAETGAFRLRELQEGLENLERQDAAHTAAEEAAQPISHTARREGQHVHA